MQGDQKFALRGVALAAFIAVNSVLADPPPAGVVPISQPSGGFAIDGDLFANTPLGGIGDWSVTNTAPGTGTGVLSVNGIPLDSTRTFHFVDPYNDSSNDRIFTGGNKWLDNPNSWGWTSGKPSGKTDINNVLLHLATDTNGHVWVILSADRYSTSGESYIDFELLQNPLTRNANGTFASTGPNGGRTTNDILLSLAFISGGSVADFVAWRWVAAPGGVYTYTNSTANMPVGGVFVALNTNTISTPYPAFGGNSYLPNAFAEAAIDLTALLGNFNQCESFGFKTIMVKTKSSSSGSAGIEDFIDPIAYTLNIGPAANAGPDQVKCSEGAENLFTLNGSASTGVHPIASTAWTVVNGSVTIDSPGSLNTTARVTSASATLRLTVTQTTGCSKSDDIVLTAQPPPNVSIIGPTTSCLRATNAFSGPAGMGSYLWSISGNGSITGPANQSSVKVVAGGVCGQGYTLTLAAGTNACTVSSSTDVLVTDITLPVLTLPVDKILDCPADTSTNANGVATATDSCSRATVTYSDSVTNLCGFTKVIGRTWTATDECGNTVSGVQMITVRDITAPVLVIPANRTLQCPADVSTGVNGVATATDGCGSATVTYNDVITPGCGGTYVLARTWTATDLCNNSTSRTQTITVIDTNPPSITIPPNVTLECPANTSTNNTGVATATDTCGNVVITYVDTATNGCGNNQTISRRWTATDECGNKSGATQTITVRDTTPPAITCPGNITLEYPANINPTNTGFATALDNCTTASVAYTDAVTNSCGNTRAIARTWSAWDSCNNTSRCVQVIIVRDTTAPVITVPPDITRECGQSTTTNATGVATATDANGVASITYADTVTQTCGNTVTIARRWTATDLCNNSSSATQTITVRDTTPPVITRPADVTVECTADTSTAATGVATATDTCGTATVTYADSVAKTCGNARIISRTWRAVDSCGNVATALQTITVRDTTPPVIACPPNVTLECPADTRTNATGVATGFDTCGNVVIGYSDTATNSCGNNQTILRRWTATDECGNISSGTQTITVRDTTAPTITCPGNITLEYPASVNPTNTGNATATDNCTAASIAYTDIVTNGCGNTRTITRTWEAWDSCNNTSRCVQVITVRDTTAPVVTAPPNLTVECGQSTLTNATGVATATDANGVASITFADSVTNTCGNTFKITRRWTAIDVCGNSSSATQTVTVRDTTPPQIIAPPSVVLECPVDTSTNANGVATASDTCGSVTISYSDSSSNVCGNARIITRTWRATDACGNVATALQTLTIRDTTAPVLTTPVDVVVECGNSTAPAATGNATATDTCNTATVSYVDSVTNLCGGTRIITRTWTATDTCGNKATGVQTITVRDTKPPTLVLPANITQQCPGDTRTNVTGVPTSVDGCGSVTLSYSDVVTNGCGGTRTVFRTWTAVDQCGNSTNGMQMIQVVDTSKPSISIPSISVQCVGDIPAAYTNFAAFVAAGGAAADGCDAQLTFALMSDTGLVGSCPGTVTRVYRVTDDCGNFAEVSHRITVDDTIPPVITCLSNMTVQCSDFVNATSGIFPTAIDNCDTNVSITYNDVSLQSSYDFGWYAADPTANSAPYLPTYLKLSPANVSCPTNGRAADPLRNAVAFGPTGATLDALTSLAGEGFRLGQVVPFETVIDVTGGPGPEHGKVEFTAAWSTHTTANDDFGYDKNYMVLCAFVDSADPGSVDPLANAKVDSFNSTIINTGTINERIQGTFRVSGLDPGDRVIVEIWVVLQATQPSHTGGTIAADIVSARKITPVYEPILTGSKTISVSANKMDPLPPPQEQPPLPPQPPGPTGPPSYVRSVIDRTWTATDACGNRSTCVQRFTLMGDAMPDIIVPADVVLEGPADTGTNVTGVATVQDVCGSVAISYSDTVSNGCGFSKVISRRWTAIDDWGNTTNAVQTITVRDTTPPTIVCPVNVAVEYPAPTSPDATGSATGSDLSGAVTIGYTDVETPVCGASKVISRTWTATDACGNTSSAIQTITVGDTTPPSITAPQNVVLEYPAKTTPEYTGTATGSDAGGVVTIIYTDVASPGTGVSQVISRTWTATDPCGNISTAVQTITVRDTTPPAIICPTNVVLECPAETGTNCVGVASATDASGAVAIGFTDATRSECGASKVIRRTWTATDSSGNVSSAVQIITVQDTTAPVITCPPYMGLEFPASTNPESTGTATASDASSPVTIEHSDVEIPHCGGTKTIIRIWTATDPCGNSSSSIQFISVRDTTAPVLVVPADIALEYPGDTSWSFTGMASASDASGAVSVSFNDVETINCGVAKTIERTWTATDSCGNSSSAVQVITVTDSTPPTLTSVTNKTITAGSPLVFDAPVASDNSGNATLLVLNTITNSISPDTYQVGRLWRARDECGNYSGLRVQTITVVPSAPIRLSISVVQSPGSQTTSLVPSPVILLSWPTNAVDYRLEYADSPAARRWYPVAVTPIVTNGEYRVYVPREGTARFFRIVNTPFYLESKMVPGKNMLLTWPTAPSGYQLEVSDTMAPGSWVFAGVSPVASNALNHVTVPAAAARKFYRLIKRPEPSVGNLKPQGLSQNPTP